MKLFHLMTVLAASLAFGAVSPARADDGHGKENEGNLSKRDKLVAKAQNICPVSGQKLGDHGAPIKARSGEMDLFLCCQGCLGQKISRKNWTQVTRKLVSAQEICPVMNKPLPKQPKWVVAKHRLVFVCCKGCIKKIEATPEKYLSIVYRQYAKNTGGGNQDHESSHRH